MIWGAPNDSDETSLTKLLNCVAGVLPIGDFYWRLAHEARHACRADVSLVAALRDEDILEYVGAAGEQAKDLFGTRMRRADSVFAQVFAARKPIFLSPGRDGEATAGGFTHGLTLPLLTDGQVVGALGVFRQDSTVAFETSDVEQLQEFCAILPIALIIDRLRSQVEKTDQYLALTSELSRQLAESGHEGEAAAALCRVARRHLHAEIAVVLIAENENDVLRTLAAEGMKASPEPIRLADAPAVAEAVKTGRVLRIPEPDTAPLPAMLPVIVRSALIAPMRVGECAIGAVVIASGWPDRYSQEAAETLLGAAQQTALAISGKIRADESAHREREASAMFKVSQGVAESSGAGAALDSVGQGVLSALEVDRFAAVILDDEQLRVAHQINIGPHMADYVTMPPNGIVGWVVASRSPYASDDLGTDPKNQMSPLPVSSTSALCVPLEREQRCIGALLALSDVPRKFTVAETELLCTLANFTAVAIASTQIDQ